MIAQLPQRLCRHGVIGDDGSPVTACTKILRRIKTEAGRIAQTANSVPVVAGAVRLRCVLDDFQFVLTCQIKDGGHVGRLPIEMDGHYGFSVWRYMTIDFSGI